MFEKSRTKIFIDTNIFLDFYRSKNEDADKVMTMLHNNKDILITTEHAYDEFIRNRNSAIQQCLNQFGSPSISSIPFICSFPEYKELEKHLGEVKKQHTKIKDKIQELLKDPHKDEI